MIKRYSLSLDTGDLYNDPEGDLCKWKDMSKLINAIEKIRSRYYGKDVNMETLQLLVELDRLPY